MISAELKKKCETCVRSELKRIIGRIRSLPAEEYLLKIELMKLLMKRFPIKVT